MLIHWTFRKTAFLLVSLIVGSQNAGMINPCIMLNFIPAYNCLTSNGYPVVFIFAVPVHCSYSCIVTVFTVGIIVLVQMYTFQISEWFTSLIAS